MSRISLSNIYSRRCRPITGNRRISILTQVVVRRLAEWPHPKLTEKGQNVKLRLVPVLPVFLFLHLTQSLLVTAEMVSYLVLYYFSYSHLNLPVRMTLSLYGLLEDTYLVRQDHPVSPAAPDLGHALIEAQQPTGISDLHSPELSRAWPVFHNDVNIFQLAAELRRQTINGSSYESFEMFSLHRALPVRLTCAILPYFLADRVSARTGACDTLQRTVALGQRGPRLQGK